MNRLAGITLLIGSVIFLIGAFSPISWVFAEPLVEKRLAMINAAPGEWRLAQFFFGAGALVAAVGLFLVYLFFRNTENAKKFSLAAFILAFTGAALWVFHVYMRAADHNAFVHGQLPVRWFPAVYFVLTQLALFLLGMAFLKANYYRWVGWLLITAAIAFIIILAVVGNIPPLNFYLITIVAACVLIFSKRVLKDKKAKPET